MEESGSAAVDALVAAGLVGTATVAFAEVHAGLARKQRDGDLTRAEYETACRQFEADGLRTCGSNCARMS